jgi:hypothetical protein
MDIKSRSYITSIACKEICSNLIKRMRTFILVTLMISVATGAVVSSTNNEKKGYPISHLNNFA